MVFAGGGGCSSAVESWIVIPVVVGSNPISHPNMTPDPKGGAPIGVAEAFANDHGGDLVYEVKLQSR